MARDGPTFTSPSNSREASRRSRSIPTASLIEVRKFEQCGSGEEFNLGHRSASLLEDRLAVVDPCSRSERVSLEIPSQSNPSRKHDAGMFSAGVEPSEAMVGKGVKVTHGV